MYKLYAITDRRYLRNGMELPEAVEQAIIGGATIVQLREKELAGEDKKQLALSVHEICKKHNVPLIINDDVQLALEIGAEGVHLGQSDMAPDKAREILGEKAIIGVTAKTIEQATRAQAQSADYLGSGAMFGTNTKADALPMSIDTFNSICQAVSIPVVAIGGINASNVSLLKDTQKAGVAVVGGIFDSEDITAAAKELLSLI